MGPPILILSNPRTGSTLLRWLLDTHPAICSPNELSLGACCYHLALVVEATLGPEYRQVSADARRACCVAEVRRIVDGLLGTYCAARRKSRWCEKTPSNLKFLDLLQAVFPDAAYLCLHRQCLDTVRSSIDTYGDAPAELQPYRDRHGGHIVASFIDRWCDLTERLLAFEAAHPAGACRVRYEDLVRDPDGVLEPLLAFIGVPWVSGLATRAFTAPHDQGRGDPKIERTTMVGIDRIGTGAQLDLRGVSASLLDRMRRLQQLIGYDARLARVRD